MKIVLKKNKGFYVTKTFCLVSMKLIGWVFPGLMLPECRLLEDIKKHPVTDLQPLIHIGGRYFLSTSTATLNTNTGTLNTYPLTIYHFPCNVTFHGMQSSLSSCPTELAVSIPLFDETNIRYVKWKSKKDDHLLNLHFKSLSIPQKVKINKTIVNDFDREIEWYDKKLSIAINQANRKIEKIKESSFTTTDEIILYVAIGLSSFNFVVLCLYIGCTKKAEKSTEVIVKTEPQKQSKVSKKRKETQQQKKKCRV